MVPIDCHESKVTPNVYVLEKIREKLKESTVKEGVATCYKIRQNLRLKGREQYEGHNKWNEQSFEAFPNELIARPG